MAWNKHIDTGTISRTTKKRQKELIEKVYEKIASNGQKIKDKAIENMLAKIGVKTY